MIVFTSDHIAYLLRPSSDISRRDRVSPYGEPSCMANIAYGGGLWRRLARRKRFTPRRLRLSKATVADGLSIIPIRSRKRTDAGIEGAVPHSSNRIGKDDRMSNLTTIVSVAGAAFAASFVEAVEALTIVLAVGLARGWRPALTGAAAALAALTLIVAALGPLDGARPHPRAAGRRRRAASAVRLALAAQGDPALDRHSSPCTTRTPPLHARRAN